MSLPQGVWPGRIALGPGGDVWALGTHQLIHVPTTGAAVVTTTFSDADQPSDLAVGPEGSVWLAQWRDVERIDPTGRTVQGQASFPSAIAVAPDGVAWFLSPTIHGGVGKMTPSGTVTSWGGARDLAGMVNRGGLAIGPDGAAWFTRTPFDQTQLDAIGRLAADGTYREFPLASGRVNPGNIVVGPDGNLWFPEYSIFKIGRLTPKGVLQEYDLPAGFPPSGITPGPGGLWFLAGDARVGRVTVTGEVNLWDVPGAQTLTGLGISAQGEVWVSDGPASRMEAFPAAAFASAPAAAPFSCVAPKPIPSAPGNQVTAVGGSADGRWVFAGTADGRVLRWSAGSPQPQVIATMTAAVVALAVDADGAVAAVSTDASGLIWRSAGAATALTAPAGQCVGAVAVSPSGRTVAVHSGIEVWQAPESIAIWDAGTGQVLSTHDDPATSGTSTMVLPSDDRILLFNDGYGDWQWRGLPDWSHQANSSAALGVHQAAGSPSADGRFITATNGASTIPVWPTSGQTDQSVPGLSASAPIRQPGPLALSPDGSHLAVANGTVAYVARVLGPGVPAPGPLRLRAPAPLVGQLHFLGPSELAASTGNQVVVWDLHTGRQLAVVAIP